MNQLEKIEYGDDLVLTTEQLAEAYECDVEQIRKNYSNNKDRFVEGKHFFKLEGDALAEFKESVGSGKIFTTLKFTSVLMLWTKRGASRHSKMLGTDRAWEMYDVLEENYFNRHPQPQSLEEQMAQGLLAAKTMLDQTRLELTQVKQIVNELQPKATYYDLVLQNKSTLSVTKIGQGLRKVSKVAECQTARVRHPVQAGRSVVLISGIRTARLHAELNPCDRRRTQPHEYEVDAEGTPVHLRYAEVA